MGDKHVPQDGGNAVPTFEIGLVMAGAISAGAYTAGVIDYLLEKLAAFEQLRQQPDGPRHRVVLKVITGASAGGITAGLLAASLAGERKTAATTPSVLYDTWVDGIDIAELLRRGDLADAKAPLQSLLDSTILQTLTDRALDLKRLDRLPPYVADPLPIHLTVTNLRGVPYRITESGAPPDTGHDMATHADHVSFLLSNADNTPAASSDSDAVPLARGTVSNSDPNWARLGQAALATSAFPIGLAPRLLHRQTRDYAARQWPIPNDQPPPCNTLKTIAPNWPPAMPDDYEFLTVDGGLMNNEPLELARQSLAGIGGRNARDPLQAHRAVVLIDPFPDPSGVNATYAANERLLAVAQAMFGSLVQQSRFKPAELELAQSQTVFSRFMIAPRRVEADGTTTRPAMCSAILGGFGGFLAQEFRVHDYQLGRRNCEAFLKRHFFLAAANPVFDGWTDRAAWIEPMSTTDPTPSLPILPIADPKAEDAPLPVRPKGTIVGREALAEQIDSRFRAVGGRLAAETVGGFLGWALKLAWSLGLRQKAVDAAMARIDAELDRLQ